ncbi:MAG: ABC transporter ATP-binding protein [Thermoflexales bacterium]|nr:ABC transporter ATP-binding protein [Thermoflexales bacterium]
MIDVEDVSVRYPNGLLALEAMTLRVAPGEFVALVGPSGCGKSTLLRAIAGLHPPTGGVVRVEGAAVRAPSRRVGLLFQDPALLPWLRVADNIALPATLGASLATPVDDLLTLVELQGFGRAWPRELSGGMAQRVALARALATRPPVLLLDEPFGALDALTREALTARVAAITREGASTCLLVTHAIGEAIFLADRVLVASPRPGRVLGEVVVDLPRPRRWEMEAWPAFARARSEVRALLEAGPRP